MESLVSVILPCYNDGGNLRRAVDSCLKQRHLHEVIIVDDCSTDSSFDVATSLCDIDSRIAVFATPKNSGPAGARNYGVTFATGHYLCFLDSDDEFLDGYFSESVALLEGQSEIRVIKPEQEFCDPVKGGFLPKSDPRHQSLMLSSVTGLMMVLEDFNRIGGFPEDSVFRGPLGGEDVAFMEAVKEYLKPIGRIEHACYRVWNRPDSHVEKFLANTRLIGESFEFISLHPDQKTGGRLAQAIKTYLLGVEGRLEAEKEMEADH